MLLSLLVRLRDGLHAEMRRSVDGQTLGESWWMLLSLPMDVQMAWLNLTVRLSISLHNLQTLLLVRSRPTGWQPAQALEMLLSFLAASRERCHRCRRQNECIKL
jgi:hypothetical protein